MTHYLHLTKYNSAKVAVSSRFDASTTNLLRRPSKCGSGLLENGDRFYGLKGVPSDPCAILADKSDLHIPRNFDLSVPPMVCDIPIEQTPLHLSNNYPMEELLCDYEDLLPANDDDTTSNHSLGKLSTSSGFDSLLSDCGSGHINFVSGNVASKFESAASFRNRLHYIFFSYIFLIVFHFNFDESLGLLERNQI